MSYTHKYIDIDPTTGLERNTNIVVVPNSGGVGTTAFVDTGESGVPGLADFLVSYGVVDNTTYSIVDETYRCQEIVVNVGNSYNGYRLPIVAKAGDIVSFWYKSDTSTLIVVAGALPSTDGVWTYREITLTSDIVNGLVIFQGSPIGAYLRVAEVNVRANPLIANYPNPATGVDASGNGLNRTSIANVSNELFKYGTTNKAGGFNGTSSVVELPSQTISAISVWINPTVNNRDLIQLTATAKISINSSNEVTTTGLTNVVTRINGNLGVDIILSGWQLLSISFDSILADAFKLGFSATYFSGKMSKCYTYNRALLQHEIDNLFFELPNTDLDLYSYGNEFVSWVDGYSAGTFTRTKEADRMRLTSGATSGDGAYVTDNLIEVTDYRILSVTSELIGSATNNVVNKTRFKTAANKLTNTPAYQFNRGKTAGEESYSKSTVEYDISAITGSYYIDIVNAVSEGTGDGRWYEIKLIK